MYTLRKISEFNDIYLSYFYIIKNVNIMNKIHERRKYNKNEILL